MKRNPRVLCVGREAADAALIEAVLSRHHPGAEVAYVGDPVQFGRELERGDFDLVVCDDRLDWIAGSGLLIEVQARKPDAAVVLLSEGDARRGEAASATQVIRPRESASFLEVPALLQAALDRSAAESTTTRLEPRVRTLLERSRLGVFRCSLGGRLLEADATFLKILGAATLDEARSLDLGPLTPQLPRGFTETGKIYKREERVPRASGELLWAAVTQVVNLDESGMPVLDGLLEDVSDRRSSESSLGEEATRLARSNEELRMFASLAAHELKEPLRTIEQSTRMLVEEQGGLDDEGAESAELVIGGVRRLQSMIEGLLTLARFGGGDQWIEECDCNELLRDVLDGLRAQIDRTGARVAVRALPTVHADPTQLRLVFRNLIGNAVKHAGAESPRIEVAARQDGDDWMFSVADEGSGIDPGIVDRLFEQFSRAGEASGAGLGLAICKRAVERHGGRIWVESEPGSGATFYFTLPLTSGIRGPGDGESTGGSAEESAGKSRREAG